jgi:hypothetical protein
MICARAQGAIASASSTSGWASAQFAWIITREATVS